MRTEGRGLTYARSLAASVDTIAWAALATPQRVLAEFAQVAFAPLGDEHVSTDAKLKALMALARHLDMFPRDSTVTVLFEQRIRALAIAEGLDPEAAIREAQAIMDAK